MVVGSVSGIGMRVPNSHLDFALQLERTSVPLGTVIMTSPVFYQIQRPQRNDQLDRIYGLLYASSSKNRCLNFNLQPRVTNVLLRDGQSYLTFR